MATKFLTRRTVLGTAALATGVLFTVLAVRARDDASAAGQAQDRPAYDGAVDRMKRYNLAFDSAYAVGVASIGVGLYLFLRPGRPAGPAERLSVSAAPDGLAVGWQAEW